MTDTIHLELPADLRYLNMVSACAAALIERLPQVDDAEAVSYNVQLALQEACTNIVTHAYGDNPAGQRIWIDFDITESPAKLIVRLRDTGTSFKREDAPAPQFDEPQVHGFGLFLMEQIMDSVVYRTDDSGNHWILEKQLEGDT